MSGAGAPTSQPFDASGLKVAVVAASWHTQVMDGLVAGAERALAAYGISEPEVIRVPGTFELPVVAAALAEAGVDYDDVIDTLEREGVEKFEASWTELLETASSIAELIAANPPATIRMAKRLLREQDQQSLPSHLELAGALQPLAQRSRDHHEAIEAMLARRRPTFTGE